MESFKSILSRYPTEWKQFKEDNTNNINSISHKYLNHGNIKTVYRLQSKGTRDPFHFSLPITQSIYEELGITRDSNASSPLSLQRFKDLLQLSLKEKFRNKMIENERTQRSIQTESNRKAAKFKNENDKLQGELRVFEIDALVSKAIKNRMYLKSDNEIDSWIKTEMKDTNDDECNVIRNKIKQKGVKDFVKRYNNLKTLGKQAPNIRQTLYEIGMEIPKELDEEFDAAELKESKNKTNSHKKWKAPISRERLLKAMNTVGRSEARMNPKLFRNGAKLL